MTRVKLLHVLIAKLLSTRKIYFKFKFFKIIAFFYEPFFIKNNFISINKIFWPIKYSISESYWIKKLWFIKNVIKSFYLRKTKFFYKGRYARNRQTCRVIVFWTVGVNLIFLYGLYFFFYQFSFNFGYFWLGLICLYLGLIISTILKNQFYNFFKIKFEFFCFMQWCLFYYCYKALN